MTQTAHRAERSAEPVPAEPVRKRPLLSRWSLAHLIMVLAGLLAFLLVLLVLHEQGESVQIAVTDSRIEAGTTLTADKVRYVEVSASDAAELGAVLTPDLIAVALEEGWVATRSIVTGVPLSTADLRPMSTGTGLRAMSVPIDPAHAANGAIGVGDLVDVIVVRDGVARYVVTSAEVVAVAEPTGGVARDGFAVTLAVDADSSLRLAVALDGGSIEVVRATGAADADPFASYDATAKAERGQ